MSDIGTERLEPTASIAERLGNESVREREPRPRPKPAVASNSDPDEPADASEPHQVDSLA